MFYRQESNQYITEGMPFTIDDVQYPSNWLNLTTPEEKAALGLVEVVTVGERKDDRYYWNSEVLEGATLTITNLPKDLDEVKKNAVAQVNQTAYLTMLPSDWMATKAFETGTTVPTDWATWRESIRQTARTATADIGSSTDVDGVKAIMDNIAWNPSPTV